MSRTASPTTGASSESISSGLLISQNDDDSIRSFQTQSQDIAEEVANMRLSEDLPIPSIEGRSSDSTGGVNILGARSHSRTPSVSLSPPPEASDHGYPRHEGSRGGSASIDGRLGMSQLANAMENIIMSSESPRASLRPERPGPRAGSPHQRRRSGSYSNPVPHDVADEELPHNRFHEPRFQSAFSDSHRLMSELADVLSSSTLSSAPDSAMRALYDSAQRLAEFRCESTRTVAFVGDSGVGKSSLLNSLLDVKGLARTSNSGEACTCVATEYRYHNSNNFAIDVEWFSEGEIAAQLSELLKSYRNFHLHELDMELQERNDLEERANLARDTFRAMFRGRLGDEQFLTVSSDSAVMATLKSWVAESGIPTVVSREYQHSIGECSARLMQLTSEDSDQQPSKWPFIRKIKVFLKAHILSKGLVLADLPGLRDLNSARKKITEVYLLDCNDIFAICNIGRATTDASVVDIFDLAKRASSKLSSVGIICTKSDDIQAEEALRDWRGGRSRSVQQFLDAIATDERDVANYQEELEYLVAIDDMSDEDARELAEFTRKSEQAKKRLKLHQFELKRYLMVTRNADVRRGLDIKYRDTVPEIPFQVFCASNKEYWEYRDLDKEVAQRHLHLSGILAIRKHCISLVTEIQLRAATKYIEDDIPELLERVELWVQSGAGNVDAEQKAMIRETLQVLEARLNRELMGNSSDISTISTTFYQTFRARIREAQRIAEWTQGARIASGIWAGWHHSSYSAFCRNFGDHYTETAGSHNWNEEAMEAMASDLRTPWENLRSTFSSDLEGKENQIEQLMDWGIQYLDTELPDSAESVDTLKRNMLPRRNLLLADVGQTIKRFSDNLSLLRTNALTGLRTSIIGQLMESSYLACINEKGGKSDARRKAIINSKLRDESTFELHQRMLRSGFKDLVDGFQNELRTAIEEHLGVIKETLDMVRDDNIALESEREPEFRARVERMVRTGRAEIERIQGASRG